MAWIEQMCDTLLICTEVRMINSKSKWKQHVEGVLSPPLIKQNGRLKIQQCANIVAIFAVWVHGMHALTAQHLESIPDQRDLLFDGIMKLPLTYTGSPVS